MKTIIEMAREAGVIHPENVSKTLEAFANLIADNEAKRIFEEGMVTVGALREAVRAEREAIIQMMPGGSSVDPQWVCDAIRARGGQA